MPCSTKATRTWAWDSKYQEAFLALKQPLLSNSLLHTLILPDLFRLYTDASTTGLREILAEVQDGKGKIMQLFQQFL